MAVKQKLSPLAEQLREGVVDGLAAQLRVSANGIGEEIARELMKDPGLKAELQQLAADLVADLRARK